MPALPWTTFLDPDPQREYVVMASRLPLRSYRQVPTFLRLTLSVRKQLSASEGLVGYALNAQLLSKTFWTLSAWTDDQHLSAFARALPHADVIRRLRPHMAPTTFETWSAPGSALPVSWKDAAARLLSASGQRRSDLSGTG